MPFKDTKEGQTHYQNDGCGEPEHNDMPPKANNEWEKRIDKKWQAKMQEIVERKRLPNYSEMYEFCLQLLSSERQRLREGIEKIKETGIDPLREEREGVRGHLINLFKELLEE